MNTGNVEYLVNRCAALANGNFITEHSVIFGGVLHDTLRELAAEFGVADTNSVSMKDLVSLYSVARKNAVAGQQVADRIAAKSGAKFSEPIWRATEPARPSAYPASPSLDETTIRKLINDTVLAETGKLQTAIYKYDDEQSKRFADMQDSIDGTVRHAVEGAVIDALKKLAPVTLSVTKGADPIPINLGLVHRMTPRIIRALAANLNVYLHGPAGSGKTTAARKAAEALGVPFYFAAKVESEYLLLGFRDATGAAVRTQFREAYEHGGLFLFDELDASSPGAVVALNAALANGVCPFPDGTIQRHENFYCIAAGNTSLTGANRQYNGRVQLDAASVDRFYFLEFGYDEAMEMQLASNQAWCAHVQALRKAVADRGLAHLITPRATLDGCKALDAGETWAEAEMGAIFKGLDKDTVEQLRNATSLFASANAA